MPSSELSIPGVRWVLEQPKDLQQVLKYLLENGKKIVVRNVQYREILGVIIKTPISFMVDELVAGSYFDPYIAIARARYIIEELADELAKMPSELQLDKNTRKAYAIKPDWYWSGHDPCIMAMQAMVRDGKIDGYVFMRSSDCLNGFPYDWTASSGILVELAKRSNSGKYVDQDIPTGSLTFFISNLHVREEDVERIKALWENSQPKS